jgi:cysteine-rich repeat protein
MKFTVNNLVGHTDPVPDTLRPIERLQEGDAVMTRDFELRRSGQDACGRAFWEINGLHWDDITEYPELGTTEIWRFINDSGVSHPMHMHLVFFQVLDREGFTTGAGGEIIPDGNPQPPSAEESGWKDTAMVGPNQILRVIARFEDYKGRYAYHCHILEHEDHEMMRQFQTVSCGDGELDAPAEGCDDGAKSDGDGCSSRCEVEQFINFVGAAQGGRVEVTIAGEVVGVDTQAGQTVEEITQALADAINANPNLQAQGINASAHGNRLVTNADFESIASTDPGVSEIGLVTVQPTRVWWGSVGGTTGYDLVGGDLNRLRETGGDYSDPDATGGCLAGDQAATYWEHLGQTVLPGEVVWYLMRTLPGGTYDTGALSQIGSRDPEIAASGNDCP